MEETKHQANPEEKKYVFENGISEKVQNSLNSTFEKNKQGKKIIPEEKVKEIFNKPLPKPLKNLGWGMQNKK